MGLSRGKACQNVFFAVCGRTLANPALCRADTSYNCRAISFSRFSRYRSSLRLTRCRALSMDLTCLHSSSAIS